MNIAIWAYLDNNFGDDLMIKLLAQKFLDINFFVYSNKSTVKNSFKEYDNITVKKNDELDADLNHISIFLTIGGSIFNDMNSKSGIIRRLFRIRFLKKIKKMGIKIVTLGCNLGPYSNKIGPKLTRIELNINDLVTVRDRVSYEMLQDYDLNHIYYLSDDIVYNLAPNTDSDKTVGLGISAYRSLSNPENNYQNYIALAKIIDNYINRTGKKVRIFAFDSEAENDLAAAHHIIHLCNQKKEIEIIPYLGDEEDFLYKFSQCERMIAIRFHSAIISDIYRIPFLPIIYSNKMKNWLLDNEYQNSLIYTENLTPNEIDLDKLVLEIIKGDGLFTRTASKDYNANLHFDKLDDIIKSM